LVGSHEEINKRNKRKREKDAYGEKEEKNYRIKLLNDTSVEDRENKYKGCKTEKLE